MNAFQNFSRKFFLSLLVDKKVHFCYIATFFSYNKKFTIIKSFTLQKFNKLFFSVSFLRKEEKEERELPSGSARTVKLYKLRKIKKNLE